MLPIFSRRGRQHDHSWDDCLRRLSSPPPHSLLWFQMRQKFKKQMGNYITSSDQAACPAAILQRGRDGGCSLHREQPGWGDSQYLNSTSGEKGGVRQNLSHHGTMCSLGQLWTKAESTWKEGVKRIKNKLKNLCLWQGTPSLQSARSAVAVISEGAEAAQGFLAHISSAHVMKIAGAAHAAAGVGQQCCGSLAASDQRFLGSARDSWNVINKVYLQYQ